jgi:hypothetical protein
MRRSSAYGPPLLVCDIDVPDALLASKDLAAGRRDSHFDLVVGKPIDP